MISILLGAELDEPDITKWLEKNGRLSPLLNAAEKRVFIPYSRNLIHSLQEQSFTDPVTGKRLAGEKANDPIIIHFNDRYLTKLKHPMSKGFSRIAGFIEPAIDLGLNIQTIVFNQHHDLLEWFDLYKLWPEHWPKRIYVS